MKHLKKLCATAVLAGTSLTTPTPAMACGLDPYLATVCTFGFNFCPRGWLEANGALISIAQNSAVFALLGTQFGGNGQTTFGLPDLRGRSVVGQGQAPGLSSIQIGQNLGAETTTLSVAQIPAHSHTATLRAATTNPSAELPTNNLISKTPGTETYSEGSSTVNMGSSSITVGNTGSGQAVPIRSPGLGMMTCIAMEGVFPPRN